jgi:cell wall-associated protease
MKSIYIILFFLFFLISCKSTKESTVYSDKLRFKKELSPLSKQTWYQKDYQQDSITGISLDKWYNQKKPKSKNVIVAVIDTQIDLKHEDLQGQIWTNPNEIPDNGIDDDHNGYIDDINGWSFTGTKSGGYVVWGNFEYTRVIRNWRQLFKDKTENQIDVLDLSNYKEYQRAVKMQEERSIYYNRWLQSIKHSIIVYPIIKDTLKHFFPKEDYTYQQLDSLYKKFKYMTKTEIF